MAFPLALAHVVERAPTDGAIDQARQAIDWPSVFVATSPRLGMLDERAVIDEFLSALSRRSLSDGMMIRRWRDAGTLIVERRPPLVTKSGKINYFHV